MVTKLSKWLIVQHARGIDRSSPIKATVEEQGRLIRFDRHSQAAGGELFLVVLGALLRTPRHD